MSPNPEKDLQIEASLNSLSYGGYACAKTSAGLVYVPKGVPGDKVMVRLRKMRKQFGSAVIEKILEPSADRVEPDCEAFDRGCGGCQWLHIAYQAQLYWKRRILQKTLEKSLGTKVAVESVIGMDNPLQYRNKLSLMRDENGDLGLMKENSKELVDFSYCKVELPVNQAVYEKLLGTRLPAWISQVHVRGNTRGEAGIVFYAESMNPEYQKFCISLMERIPGVTGIGLKTYRGFFLCAGKLLLEETVGAFNYSFPIHSFFQTNYMQAEKLVSLAMRKLELALSDRVMDLFSGVGLFTLPAAKKAKTAVGIENDRDAVAAAVYNSETNKVGNASFLHKIAETGIRNYSKGDIDALVTDPPRTGLSQQLVTAIQDLRPERIVYISCSPDTLARDLLMLSPYYSLASCSAVDMFPHTYHTETAVLLVAKGTHAPHVDARQSHVNKNTRNENRPRPDNRQGRTGSQTNWQNRPGQRQQDHNRHRNEPDRHRREPDRHRRGQGKDMRNPGRSIRNSRKPNP
ncbi:MAG: 23S rRNA (uracil(1939)-C(5))-methyltransferase RlmD [Spirochaetaceae bacterium]|nr:MAG: 23S rRNA (uracil(1939)-C(5))-methyltransferase RlmD [Spirochaetaceae bacterium]